MSENKYRDTSGRNLTDYPRPSVAVDTAVLALDPEQGLVLLEVRRPTGMGWALPGTFIHEGETLAEAVDRSLRVKANVRGLHPRQLHVFDDPTRDDRGWVLSVAHVASGPAGTVGGPLRRHNEARVNRRAWAAAIRPRRHHQACSRGRSYALSRQAGSGRTSRRRVHASGITNCSRGDRRTAVATRHLPTCDGTAPCRHWYQQRQRKGPPCRAFPPIQVINSRTRRHAAGCIAGRPGLPARSVVGAAPSRGSWQRADL